MDLRIDDKGKYYTQHVTKDMLPAFIRTTSQVIIGNIHTRPDRRLKDELDDDKSGFLPVTDARIYNAETEQLVYHSAVMLVAYAHIIMISPLETHENIRDTPWMAGS